MEEQKLSSLAQRYRKVATSLNKATSGIKLPWAKFPGEMHLAGHNFTGPGTNLDKRLNQDLTPNEWSQPINRVDKAACHHDLAYAKHPDTASRNVADRIMINQLNSISNPTAREKNGTSDSYTYSEY